MTSGAANCWQPSAVAIVASMPTRPKFARHISMPGNFFSMVSIGRFQTSYAFRKLFPFFNFPRRFPGPPQLDSEQVSSGADHGDLPGAWINIKMPSYQYRKSHCGDKTILRPSYLHNGISCTGKMPSLYWIRALGWEQLTHIGRTAYIDLLCTHMDGETLGFHKFKKSSELKQTVRRNSQGYHLITDSPGAHGWIKKWLNQQWIL